MSVFFCEGCQTPHDSDVVELVVVPKLGGDLSYCLPALEQNYRDHLDRMVADYLHIARRAKADGNPGLASYMVSMAKPWHARRMLTFHHVIKAGA